MKKLNSPCSFCKHAASNVHGEYCSKANYESNSYGHFWRSNSCVHDANHPKLGSFFEPVSPEQITQKESQIIELRGEILGLKSENMKLRSLIK